ncbi:MAG: PAS domain S-box protein [Gemmatimonadaceae bacterium]|nr:PAS domain S-box protein [Gemmatimonadaceae bacterium]
MGTGGANGAHESPALEALNLGEILPAIDGFLFLLSGDGEIHDYRAGTPEDLFLPPEQFLGRRIRDLFPPESTGAIDAALRDAETLGSARVQYSLPMADGMRVYEAQIIPLSGHRRLAIVRQVTERARRDAESHANASRLRAILEATLECVMVIAPDGTLLEMNAAGLAMLEVPDLATAQRAPLADVVCPEYRTAFAAMLQRVLGGDSPTLTFELAGRHGTRRWVESNAVPLRNAQGTIDAVLSVSRDITARRQADGALRESEERLAEAVRAYGIGIFEHDHRTDRIYYSPALRVMRGWTVDQPITLSAIVHGIHPDDRAAVVSAIASAHDPAGAGDYDVEYRVVRPDGSVRWVRSRAHTTFEGSGKGRRAARTVGAIADVTDQREREEALRTRDAAIEASLNGLAIATLDGVLAYTNPAFQRMWHLGSPREALGRKASDFWLHREEAEEVTARLLDVGSWQGELTALRADGSTFLVALSAAVVRNARGENERISASFVDITDRRLAQEALRQSEERFRALIENGLDLVLTLDRSAIIRFASPSVGAILGYSASEAVGLSLVALLHPDDVAQSGTSLGDVCEGKRESTQLAVRARHRSGEWRQFEGTVRSLLHVRAVRGTVANLRDVTEQRDLEARLRQSQKLDSIGRLAGGVAHDFNNILTAVLGYTQLLEGDLTRGEAIKPDDLREVRLAAERARALTSQLLAFARRQLVSPRAVDLNAAVSASERMLRRLVGEDIAITTELDPTPWLVYIDPSQLEQVILNLAVNARDAMPEGGLLTLGTEHVVLTDEHLIEGQGVVAGPFALLTVSDSGSGIPPEALPHLFEPFYTTKRQGEGTGLGLATVYGIVRQAGGMVDVESTPGIGTRFRIYLPRATAPAPESPEQLAPRPERRGSERILVAEDDPAVRSLTVRALTEAGYHVQAAASAEDALSLVRRAALPFALLVTDVIMPGWSGPALADALREQLPLLRVLFVSGYAKDRIGEHELRREGVSFLQKPFTPHLLVQRVREALDG